VRLLRGGRLGAGAADADESTASILLVTYLLFFVSVFLTDWVPWTVLTPLHASAMLLQLYVLGFVTRALVTSRFGSLRCFP
jgi:hypothetical protein